MKRTMLFAGIAGLTLSACIPSAEEPSAVLLAKEPQASPNAQEPPSWASPAAAGLDTAALHRLVEGARDSGADALVVVKDGRLVVEDYFRTPEGPIEAMSATKSVVSLAVGLLLDEGRLASVDQLVSDFYPEWKQGRKRRITLRQLLDHTSGLQEARWVPDDVYPSPDVVQFALAAELSSDPGAVWTYNNKAVNLIAGIVKKASGQRMEEYLRNRLFAPLGIERYSWSHDEVGNPLCMSGLQIRPRDLARIGEMLADGGTWRGKRILSTSWIDASTSRQSQDLNPSYGLLWWLVGGKVDVGPMIDQEGIAKLRKAGVDPAFIEKVTALKGRMPKNEGESIALIKRVLGPDGLHPWMREVVERGILPKSRRLSPPTAFEANGYRGQYLWVSPKDRLVVVCMHRVTKKDISFELERLEFPEFTALAMALMSSPGPMPK